MIGKSPRTRFLARVMNPHAQDDRCIVPERSEAFGKPGCVRICNKLQKTGNRQLHQGQGPQDIMQVQPMSKEEPRARINRHSTTRAALPNTQTSSEDSEHSMNAEKANLQLEITMLCIETHMVQVGAWEQLRGLKEGTGGHARGK